MLALVTTAAGRPLVGREAESRLLLRRLDSVGEAPVVTGFVGEPGTGKTALMDEGVRAARDRGFAVLAARGSEAEENLPFSALHQLLRPLLHKVDQLSGPQRRALLACFAMGEAEDVNPLFVALATLELLAAHAADAPVLVCLDDLDRMDRSSTDALGFVVRRLQGERVTVVCTSRRPGTKLGDGSTDEWRALEGLEDDASIELLRSRSTSLSSALEQRVVREAGGNPLALIEFATALETGRQSWSDLDVDLPMTTRLEAAFAVRAGELDHAGRAVVDVLAVDDGSTVDDVLAAASILHGAEIGGVSVERAKALGLVSVSGDRCRIASPLVGSALRQTMSASRRRSAHAALADVLVADRDRAIWHRAAAVDGRDEDVAADLERAAADARRRGAVDTAARWLDRAAMLSPDQAARTSRLLSSAELAFELGRFEQVEEIKERVAGSELSVRDRSRLTWLEGAFHDGSSSEPSEVSRLVALARRATADGDVDLALQLLFGASRRVWWRDPGDVVRAEIVEAVRQVPLPPHDPRILAAMGLAESFELSPTVIEQLGQWPSDAHGRPDLAGLLGIAAFCIGEFERADTYLTLAIQELRHQGRLSLLAEALAIRSWTEVNLGIFDPARSADEAVRLGDETGQAVWAATARIAVAVSDGVAGRWVPRHPMLAEAETTAVRMPNASSSLLAGVQQARGMAELGADRPEQAYGELCRIFEADDPAFQRVQQLWVVGYLADAAVRTDRRADARALLDASARLAGPSPASGYAISLEYADAVLADDRSAEAAFEAALSGAAGSYPWHRARLHLAHGSWLRRQRRVVESRQPLRAARGTFAALGAGTWAARADQELRAAGEVGWQAEVHPREELSAQEAQIADLAAQGLSNREIGQRLFVSHRTVGSHLYRIFPKLGITSRHQLAGALARRG
jgi:DNA-binding NarL/FixJ family response regulator